MISWIQIIKAVVALAVVAGVVLWIHRASVKHAENAPRKGKSHS